MSVLRERRRMLCAALWLVAVAIVTFAAGWFSTAQPVSEILATGIAVAAAGTSVTSGERDTDWSAFVSSVNGMTTDDCIAALGESADREEIERLRFLDWARRDPVAAIVAAGEDQEERKEAFWAAAESKPQEALDFLKTQTGLLLEGIGEDVEDLLREFLGRWAKHDIEAVKLALMDPHWKNLGGSDTGALDAMTLNLGQHWPKDDPAGWVRWVAEFGMTEPKYFNYFTGMCFYGHVDASQIRSLSTFAEMAPGLQRDAALAAVCSVIPTGVAMSALDLVSAENRVMVAASIASAMDDPAAAMRWFAEQAPREPPAKGSLFDNDVDLPISEWLSSPVPEGIEHLSEWPEWLRERVVRQSNGELAGELALAFSPPEEVANRVQKWATRNADQTAAASQWVGSIDPADPGRDSAIVGLIRGVANDDPGGAYAWAESLADPALRERQLRVTISILAERDAAAAQVALEGARGGGMLSEAALASLIKEIQNRAEEGAQ